MRWLVLAAIGCNEAAPPPKAPPVAPAAAIAAIDAPAERFAQGEVSVEPGGLVFTPCGVSSASKLQDDTALLARVAQEQGGRVYIEGRLADVSGDLHLTALHRVLPGGAEACRRVSWQWTAKGAEPFWSLVVGARTATMHQTGPSPHLEGDIALSVDSKGVAVFGQVAIGTLDARFTPEPCTDASGWYSHTATVKLGPDTLHGCAAPGEGP